VVNNVSATTQETKKEQKILNGKPFVLTSQFTEFSPN